jgi:hypothetical protein
MEGPGHPLNLFCAYNFRYKYDKQMHKKSRAIGSRYCPLRVSAFVGDPAVKVKPTKSKPIEERI